MVREPFKCSLLHTIVKLSINHFSVAETLEVIMLVKPYYLFIQISWKLTNSLNCVRTIWKNELNHSNWRLLPTPLTYIAYLHRYIIADGQPANNNSVVRLICHIAQRSADIDFELAKKRQIPAKTTTMTKKQTRHEIMMCLMNKKKSVWDWLNSGTGVLYTNARHGW